MNNHIKIYGLKPRIQYVADGKSVNYEFPFAIFKSSDINVYLGDVLQDVSAYSVSFSSSFSGGSVQFATAPTNGTIITIIRNLSVERTSDFQEGSVLRAEVLNDELDYQIACQQQIAEILNRSIVLPPYAVDNDLDLTLPLPSAGKAIVWNAEGTNLENSTVEVNALENTLKEYKNAAQSSSLSAQQNANTAIQQAQIASQKAAEAVQTLAQKADIEMSNLSESGKNSVVELSMPSAIGQSLTFGASGTQYTAPANGWFCVFVTGVSGTNIQIALQNITTPLRILGMEMVFFDQWGSGRLFCPVKKGDTVALNYGGAYSSKYIHFIQAIGG